MLAFLMPADVRRVHAASGEERVPQKARPSPARTGAWAMRDSNARHPACKAGALPAELTARCGRIVVGGLPVAASRATAAQRPDRADDALDDAQAGGDGKVVGPQAGARHALVDDEDRAGQEAAVRGRRGGAAAPAESGGTRRLAAKRKLDDRREQGRRGRSATTGGGRRSGSGPGARRAGRGRRRAAGSSAGRLPCAEVRAARPRADHERAEEGHERQRPERQVRHGGRTHSSGTEVEHVGRRRHDLEHPHDPSSPSRCGGPVDPANYGAAWQVAEPLSPSRRRPGRTASRSPPGGASARARRSCPGSTSRSRASCLRPLDAASRRRCRRRTARTPCDRVDDAAPGRAAGSARSRGRARRRRAPRRPRRGLPRARDTNALSSGTPSSSAGGARRRACRPPDARGGRRRATPPAPTRPRTRSRRGRRRSSSSSSGR